MAEDKAVYGYCPTCGQPGIARARDFIGTTRCAQGHEWVPPRASDGEERMQAMQDASLLKRRYALKAAGGVDVVLTGRQLLTSMTEAE